MKKMQTQFLNGTMTARALLMLRKWMWNWKDYTGDYEFELRDYKRAPR